MARSKVRTEDILGHRKMANLMLTAASHPPQPVSIPFAYAFCIENCGKYRKLRFKGPVGRGREITVGAGKMTVTFVDVTESVRHILAVQKWPYQPIAWWVGVWGSQAARHYRTLKVLGTDYLLVVECPEGVDPAVLRQAAENALQGCAFDGWMHRVPEITTIVEFNNRRYNVKLHFGVL